MEFLEIFVVDGMSSDNTRDIVKEYTKKYKNISISSDYKILFEIAEKKGSCVVLFW